MTGTTIPTQTPTPTGERRRRKQGDLMLTGRGGYLDDIELPHTLHASIVRSTEPHARLLEVDLSLARQMPGVHYAMAGIEALDHISPVPHWMDPGMFGAQTNEFRSLAVDKVIHEGEAIAVVVADTLAQAEAARDAVRVVYEPLPAVFDPEAALEAGAPQVFDHWEGNALADFPFIEGDPDAVFAAAEHTVSGRIRIQRYNTAPLETRGYIATWGMDGRLTFYASTQNPHPLRSHLALSLGMPENQIRVVTARVGGGFGHKFHGYPEEPLLCVLSKIVNAPVKYVETRSESMLIGGREYIHDFEVAHDEAGRILALRDRVLGNIGGLGSLGGWGMTYVSGMSFPGGYKIKDYEVHAVPVATHIFPWNGAISYGKESATLTMETICDLIADATGVDPVQVRRVNFIPSDEFPYWMKAKRLDSGNYDQCWTRLVELGELDARRAEQAQRRECGELVGLGLAFELCPEGGDFPGALARGFDSSTVRIDPTGTVTVLSGVTSPGTGNETGIAQVVAREFGIDIDDIAVMQGDTDVVPYGYGNFSSRAMNVGGGSALIAARELKETLGRAAMVMLELDVTQEVDIAEIEFADGLIRPPGTDGLPFREVVDTIYRRSIAVPALDRPQLEATATWGPSNLLHVPNEKGQTSGYPTFPYSAHLVGVQIDPETGVVTVEHYTCVHDCGVVINETFVDGQLQGSIAMGIGGALWEHLPYTADGHRVAHTFKQYLTPRAPDLPRVRLGHECTPSPFTVLGTKGAGESGVAGAVAGVANAVNDALRPLGVRIFEMPLSAPRVLRAIQEGRNR